VYGPQYADEIEDKVCVLFANGMQDWCTACCALAFFYVPCAWPRFIHAYSHLLICVFFSIVGHCLARSIQYVYASGHTQLRRALECCSSPQSFFVLHSLGGGTGSGVGSFIIQMMEERFPELFRFVVPVFPSEDDDVIVSPYNATLSMNTLAEHADCVLPIDNQALADICAQLFDPTSSAGSGGQQGSGSTAGGIAGLGAGVNRHGMAKAVRSGAGSNEARAASITGQTSASKGPSTGGQPYDEMNSIAASLLTHLTSSMRFEGSLNIDLNEISMNLVPFPKLKFLIPALSPLYVGKDAKRAPRRLDQMFTDGFSPSHQLIKADPKREGAYLACALMVRGNTVQIGDINRNLTKVRGELRMAHWNTDAFKVGLCSVPPVGMPHSMLTLANNTCIANTFDQMKNRFQKLYKRKAHVHHYTQFLDDPSIFDDSVASLESLISEYQKVDKAAVRRPGQPGSESARNRLVADV
jgi:tubulin epsilon